MSCRYCPLFDGRDFQYGPACAFAQGAKRILAYYPLGSGKTLAAIHGAATFLDAEATGKVVVVTTLSNVGTTWSRAIKMYRRAIPKTHKKALKNAEIHNPDWWYSQDNLEVAHYNSMMSYLSKKTDYTRRQLQTMSPNELIRQCNDKERRREFRAKFSESSERKRGSMLKATIPTEPFCLIVDECQEYINLSAQTELINALASAASFTILLSATPVHDARRLIGLKYLLGNPRSLRSSVLWTDFSEDVPLVEDSDVRFIEMQPEEWRVHQKAVRKKTSTGHSENAYLTKSRQKCNCESKWWQIKEQIESDITGSVVEMPVRIVVYSFFRSYGVDGFFKFLKKEWECGQDKKRLVHEIDGRKVRVAMNVDKTLSWFNKDENDVKILLLTSKDGVGISLRNVRWFHLMEPQWSDAEDQQAIGRATRKGSHELVEPFVEVYRWLSVPPTGTRGKSAGQKVRAQMIEKKRRTESLLSLFGRMGRDYLADILAKTVINR